MKHQASLYILLLSAIVLATACEGTDDTATPVSSTTPTPSPSGSGTAFININSPTGVSTTPVDFVVTATQTASAAITFTYATADGTAVAGTDYTATNGTGTIAAGSTSTTIAVNTTATSANKNFTMTISAPTNASLGGAPTGTASMHATPAFELVITTTPESGTGAPTTVADCVIALGSPTYGAAVPCTNAVGAITTSVTIPEGQLFFGNLGFTLNVGAQTGTPVCARASFRPYYYLVTNTNAAFTAPWNTTAIDCTTVPTPVACYGGIAQDIVPQFPMYGGVYFLPSILNTSNTWTSKSANSHSYGSNRYSVNNLVGLGPAVTFTTGNIGDGFIGGAANYQEYGFSCEDAFDQPVYSFTLTITDQDIMSVYPNASQGTRSINQFPDWDPAAWDR